MLKSRNSPTKRKTPEYDPSDPYMWKWIDKKLRDKIINFIFRHDDNKLSIESIFRALDIRKDSNIRLFVIYVLCKRYQGYKKDFFFKKN